MCTDIGFASSAESRELAVTANFIFWPFGQKVQGPSNGLRVEYLLSEMIIVLLLNTSNYTIFTLTVKQCYQIRF